MKISNIIFLTLFPFITMAQSLSDSSIEWKISNMKSMKSINTQLLGGSIVTDSTQLKVLNNKGLMIYHYLLENPVGVLLDASGVGRVRYFLKSDNRRVGLFQIDKSSSQIRMLISINSNDGIPEEVEYEISAYKLRD